MSVLIKGMEMPPESCESCPFEDFGGCMFRVQKENCPLEEVPTPHGRLIDAEKLERDIEQYHLSDGKFQHWVQVQNSIIEAEEDSHE